MKTLLVMTSLVLIACGRERPTRDGTRDLERFIAQAQLEHPLPPAPTPAHPIDVTRPDVGEPPNDMVTIPASPPGIGRFYLDKNEVTVGAYQECASLGACRSGEDLPPCVGSTLALGATYPMTCVAEQDVLAYCHFRGKRVPTDKEWMRAAIGHGTKYPWGNAAPSCKLAALDGCSGGRPIPVGSRPRGRSAEGVFDLAGNVSELVRYTNPNDPSDLWGWGVAGVVTPYRDLAGALRELDSVFPGGEIGFRCARDPT